MEREYQWVKDHITGSYTLYGYDTTIFTVFGVPFGAKIWRTRFGKITNLHGWVCFKANKHYYELDVLKEISKKLEAVRKLG